MDPALQLEPASARTRQWWNVLALALPLAAIGVAVALAATVDPPERLIGGSVPLTAALVGGGAALVTVAVWWGIGRRLRRHCLRVGPDGLEILTTFYRQHLGLEELELEQARVVDLGERGEFRPMLKTNGTALPGFQSGWFRLRNRDKAFVARAGGGRVLLLPTTRGHVLLLQPRQPRALLERLRELAAGARHG
ncbi:hypothetical protein QFW77_14045 [Luteimonas sp. RD2P54]|uniref:Bacterial Pleckstrin homology domain-containing protein n=1 Tax=Luteimonas endophytica TaxID=3042023 RepID=A0ABT6JBB3_9GAMM|nr:hypothetical protein [Luteimonas endophytica]MDH5824099.1 hypothetical protein [Luteimonas endophytica]